MKMIWSTAAEAVTAITVCATELSVKKNKRKVWVESVFQRRQSKGSCEMLLRGLNDEDPDLFRSYLRMDIDSFDYLLNMLIANFCSKWQKRSMGMTPTV